MSNRKQRPSPLLAKIMEERGYEKLSLEQRQLAHKQFLEQADKIQRGDVEAGRRYLRAMRGGSDA